jgi:hypothetical protein
MTPAGEASMSPRGVSRPPTGSRWRDHAAQMCAAQSPSLRTSPPSGQPSPRARAGEPTAPRDGSSRLTCVPPTVAPRRSGGGTGRPTPAVATTNSASVSLCRRLVLLRLAATNDGNASVTLCQEAEFASVLFGQADEALAHFAVSPDALAELGDDLRAAKNKARQRQRDIPTAQAGVYGRAGGEGEREPPSSTRRAQGRSLGEPCRGGPDKGRTARAWVPGVHVPLSGWARPWQARCPRLWRPECAVGLRQPLPSSAPRLAALAQQHGRASSLPRPGTCSPSGKAARVCVRRACGAGDGKEGAVFLALTCECSEMAFPRNWLNSFTPMALRTTTTSGENTPVS